MAGHASPRPLLPKLARPRSDNIYPRARLFRRLDALAHSPLTWIDGPAGAGKTTLVASYLEHRRIKSVWYRIDSNDGDLATLFHYLTIGLTDAFPAIRHRLPALTTDHLPTIGVFARGFFAEGCRQMRQPFAFVFDNCEAVSDEAPLSAVLAEAADALPKLARLIVISRKQPGPTLARAQLHKTLDRLDAVELRMTEAEVLRLAVARTGRVKTFDLRERVRRVWSRTDGWVAGVILQLSAPATVDHVAGAEDEAGRRLVFDYFAREVLERADEEERSTLLLTAELPYISAAFVETLTGSPRGGSILAELNRQNYFISHSTETDTYRLHPLFREFLAARQRLALSPAEQETLRRRCAQLLEETGALDEALDTYHTVPDWEAVARLVRQHAGTWVAQSRLQTLAQRLAQLPPPVVEGEPWLLYWRGLTRTALTPMDARHDLERAYAEFGRRDDADGLYSAWASIIATLFAEWSDFSSADHWVATFEALRVRHKVPGPEIAPRVTFAVLCVLSHRFLWHPDLEEAVARAEAFIRVTTEKQQPLWLELYLVLYLHHLWTGRMERIRPLVQRIAAAATEPTHSPTFWLAARNVLAIQEWILGDPRATERLVQEGLELVARHGLVYWRHQLIGQGATAAVLLGDHSKARDYLAQMQAWVDAHPDGPIYGSHFHWVAAAEAIEIGQCAVAAEHAGRGVQLAHEARFTFGRGCNLIVAANAAFLHGARDDATAHLSAARALAEHTRSQLFQFWAVLTEATWAIADRSEDADPVLLRKAIAASRTVHGAAAPGVPRSLLAELYGVALERGIEIDHVREQISRFALAPPGGAPGIESWPFPLKLFTLGRFSIVKDGEPLRFATKAQKRPLELLKALVALGGRGVDERTLADVLWPDAEADLARQNLKATVHRARKLVGAEAIVLEGGKLTLDARHCWIDSWAFERCLNPVLDAGDGVAARTIAPAVDRALRLYHGPFLSGDDQRFVFASRDRLGAKLVLATERLVRAFESERCSEESVRYLERALDVGPVAEPLYQLLIRAHLARGRTADALQAYDRCAKQLDRTLAARPSRETEALREQAQKLAG
jgi:ATP/maltotriose-dependent transcriptional regulator MalT/DNA-binding SARP family transcriptional activator